MVEGMGHVSSAVAMLNTALEDQSYDNRLSALENDPRYSVPQNLFDSWRDELINDTLNGVGAGGVLLDDVLRMGSGFKSGVWNSVFYQVSAQVDTAADDYPRYGATTMGAIRSRRARHACRPS